MPRKPLEPKATSTKEWDKAETLTPAVVDLMPELVIDGGGLPFTLESLRAPFDPLEPDAPGVEILLEQIEAAAGKTVVRLPWKQRDPEVSRQQLEGWRILARDESEIVFGRGAPPALVTVSVQRTRGERWSARSVNTARQLRVTRDGIRASSFRVDPDAPPAPEATLLRLLVSEQTLAGGKLAHGRFLTPELHVDAERVLLRFYITPLPGWQARTRRWETPVLVQLPEPLGERQVVDGAVYFQPAPRESK